MSNPEYVHRALAALAPEGYTFHDDQAPDDAIPPWIVGSLEVPDSILVLSSRATAGTARWWVTVSAETAASARAVTQKAMDAWEGARVDVAGYSLGSLVHRYRNGPYAAGLTATDTNLRFQVVRLRFDLTMSRIPAP